MPTAGTAIAIGVSAVSYPLGMAINAGELPEGGTPKATFRKGAEGPTDQRGGAGGDQGGTAGDGGEAGAVGI